MDANLKKEDLEEALQKKAFLYDKSGEEHYNLISALHKSLRGSDPDGALYWLARMLEAEGVSERDIREDFRAYRGHRRRR